MYIMHDTSLFLLLVLEHILKQPNKTAINFEEGWTLLSAFFANFLFDKYIQSANNEKNNQRQPNMTHGTCKMEYININNWKLREVKICH